MVLACSAVLAAAGTVSAADITDTTLGTGIGTYVPDALGPGSGVTIQTSIDSVTYQTPTLVRRNGLEFYEVQGSVRGTGWGGEVDPFDPAAGPGEPWAADVPYTYDVPFVLRWPATFSGTLVYYAHGHPNLGVNLLLDQMLGDADEARRLDLAESEYVAIGALAPQRGFAVFAANLGGQRRDGTPSATSLDPAIAQPLNLSIDVPITRDLAMLARRLLTKLAARRVTRVYGVGHSGGALLMQFINSGVSTPVVPGPFGASSIFSGGNLTGAYDSSSQPIFDGFVPVAGSFVRVNPAFPSAAPMLAIAGTADYAGVDIVRYADRLLRAGVNLGASLRIYQVGTLPHNFAEIVESTPNQNALLAGFGIATHADSDRLAPMVAAALDNLHAWVTRGVAPPRSRINGRAVDTDGDGEIDTIQFAQHGGFTTVYVPFGDDAANDMEMAETLPMSTPQGFGAYVSRYAETLMAMDHDSEEVSLPYNQCRVGAYALDADARLLPFTSLPAVWSDVGQYRACVLDTITQLSQQRLYDATLARRVVFTSTYVSLFSRQP